MWSNSGDGADQEADHVESGGGKAGMVDNPQAAWLAVDGGVNEDPWVAWWVSVDGLSWQALGAAVLDILV